MNENLESKERAETEENNVDKMERLKVMRDKLAKNMGTSNYFFYLESNIKSKGTRGI